MQNIMRWYSLMVLTQTYTGADFTMVLHSILLLLPLLLTNSWSLSWMTAAGCVEQGSIPPCQVIWHRAAWEIWASRTWSLKQSLVLVILVLLSGENNLADILKSSKTKPLRVQCATYYQLLNTLLLSTITGQNRIMNNLKSCEGR